MENWPCGPAAAVERDFSSISSSCQNLAHHFPRHIGQAEIAAAEAERKTFMIDAEAMQDRRVQVVDVDWVVREVVAVVVGAAVQDARASA